MMILCLCLWLSGDGINPGDTLWVGYGMAKGYGLPFASKMEVLKAREIMMKEVRVILSDNKKYYLKADFTDDYAFREDPYLKYDFTPEQWDQVASGLIHVGMSQEIFLCIMPMATEIHQVDHRMGVIESWLYRDEPVVLFGSRAANPPSAIYYFQNGFLVYAVDNKSVASALTANK